MEKQTDADTHQPGGFFESIVKELFAPAEFKPEDITGPEVVNDADGINTVEADKRRAEALQDVSESVDKACEERKQEFLQKAAEARSRLESTVSETLHGMSQSASDAKEYVKDVLSSDKDTSTGAFEDIHESVLGKASEATGELGEATEGLKEWAKSAALDIDSDRGHGLQEKAAGQPDEEQESKSILGRIREWVLPGKSHQGNVENRKRRSNGQEMAIDEGTKTKESTTTDIDKTRRAMETKEIGSVNVMSSASDKGQGSTESSSVPAEKKTEQIPSTARKGKKGGSLFGTFRDWVTDSRDTAAGMKEAAARKQAHDAKKAAKQAGSLSMESRKEVGSTNTGERGESKETRPKALESAQDSGPQEGEEKASGMASISQTTEALKDFGAKITDTLGGMKESAKDVASRALGPSPGIEEALSGGEGAEVPNPPEDVGENPELWQLPGFHGQIAWKEMLQTHDRLRHD